MKWVPLNFTGFFLLLFPLLVDYTPDAKFYKVEAILRCSSLYSTYYYFLFESSRLNEFVNLPYLISVWFIFLMLNF